MCGFAGFINFNAEDSRDEYIATVKSMNACIQYRGPDGSGEWVSEKDGVAFGHRRLSIIDLSDEGHQPMVSESGRFVITYNGEVYNFKHLRNKLKKDITTYRGHSDTEIILACIEDMGTRSAVKEFNGMYSFALWDRLEKRLFLVRDRLGIKPLYYAKTGSDMIFASELKPIIESGKIEKRIDSQALGNYFKYNCVPAPRTIFEDVSKLEPGSMLEFNLKTQQLTISTYWNRRDVFKKGVENTFPGTEQEAITKLTELLDDSVNLRMVSDVPLGAFLSGGIDSSLVVATMQKLSSKPIKSFSIGFNESEFNEATHAKKVAEHLGTDHTEMYVSEKDALDVIPDIPTIWDEPFADSSQIPTYLVSKMTRQHVTVALSGDGGDEMFGGYRRYHSTNKIWASLSKVPYPIRNGLGTFLECLPKQFIDGSYKVVDPFLSEDLKFNHRPSSKVQSIAEILSYKNSSEVYDRVLLHWKDIPKLLNAKYYNGSLDLNRIPGRNFIEQMMGYDLLTYLPDDILTKVDRASMANSLEARVPLLDHRIVEFAWRLPYEYKVKKGNSKWILKQILYDYVPQKMLDRPKMGFGIPLAEWLREPLRDWATDLLNVDQLAKHNLLNDKVVKSALDRHLNDEADLHYYIWDVLMFQSWYNEWM